MLIRPKKDLFDTIVGGIVELDNYSGSCQAVDTFRLRQSMAS
jgi:hypothetical protein